MGDKKEKANKPCFEQKNKEAEPQMKHYHFKRVKTLDNNISHQQLRTSSLHSLRGL